MINDVCHYNLFMKMLLAGISYIITYNNDTNHLPKQIRFIWRFCLLFLFSLYLSAALVTSLFTPLHPCHFMSHSLPTDVLIQVDVFTFVLIDELICWLNNLLPHLHAVTAELSVGVSSSVPFSPFCDT